MIDNTGKFVILNVIYSAAHIPQQTLRQYISQTIKISLQKILYKTKLTGQVKTTVLLIVDHLVPSF